MTTDNRTNEQAIETAARVIYDHSTVNDEGNVCQCGHETGHDLAFHQAERLHAAGRLAEPSMSENNVSKTVIGLHFSEAQVKIAHRAYYEADPQGGYWQAMRAALMAAASVAPTMQQVSESDLVERAAAEKAYEIGRLDERHDCNRFAEWQQGKITEEQLQRDMRTRNPYRREETE